jgi:hypothetical protein
MSLTASRVSLRHRCTIERDENLDNPDDWGNPSAPDWQEHLTDLPCRAWTDAGREAVDDKRIAVIVDRRLIIQLGTDVTERDRIASVSYRGSEILDGPMDIEAVLVRPDHLELVLVRAR